MERRENFIFQATASLVGNPEEFPKEKKKKMDRLEKDMVELCKPYSCTYFGTETVERL